MAMGVLFTVFFAGFALPSINPERGFAAVCETAQEMAKEKNTDNYYVYGIRRPNSMYVFFNQDVIKVEENELLNGEYSNGVLIIANRRLKNNEARQSYIADKPIEEVGNYVVVAL